MECQTLEGIFRGLVERIEGQIQTVVDKLPRDGLTVPQKEAYDAVTADGGPRSFGQVLL